jgi:hypothetical protein
MNRQFSVWCQPGERFGTFALLTSGAGCESFLALNRNFLRRHNRGREANAPATQTAEAGSAVHVWVDGSSPLPLFYLWYRNVTNFISFSRNCDLELTNMQFSQAGAYSVVLSNALGALTKFPGHAPGDSTR